jgi:hypothetical protein
MGKKGAGDLLYSVTIFIILNVLFFAVMFIFVARAGGNAAVYEQVYAKQIALLIDQAKPGTTILIDISKLYEISRKNNYYGRLVRIDSEKNEVIVSLTGKQGYSYKFFNSLNIESYENRQEEKLYLTIK